MGGGERSLSMLHPPAQHVTGFPLPPPSCLHPGELPTELIAGCAPGLMSARGLVSFPSVSFILHTLFPMAASCSNWKERILLYC